MKKERKKKVQIWGWKKKVQKEMMRGSCGGASVLFFVLGCGEVRDGDGDLGSVRFPIWDRIAFLIRLVGVGRGELDNP